MLELTTSTVLQNIWLCSRHQSIIYKQRDTETETKEKIRNKRENLHDKKEAKSLNEGKNGKKFMFFGFQVRSIVSDWITNFWLTVSRYFAMSANRMY